MALIIFMFIFSLSAACAMFVMGLHYLLVAHSIPWGVYQFVMGLICAICSSFWAREYSHHLKQDSSSSIESTKHGNI